MSFGSSIRSGAGAGSGSKLSCSGSIPTSGSSSSGGRSNGSSSRGSPSNSSSNSSSSPNRSGDSTSKPQRGQMRVPSGSFFPQSGHLKRPFASNFRCAVVFGAAFGAKVFANICAGLNAGSAAGFGSDFGIAATNSGSSARRRIAFNSPATPKRMMPARYINSRTS